MDTGIAPPALTEIREAPCLVVPGRGPHTSRGPHGLLIVPSDSSLTPPPPLFIGCWQLTLTPAAPAACIPLRGGAGCAPLCSALCAYAAHPHPHHHRRQRLASRISPHLPPASPSRSPAGRARQRTPAPLLTLSQSSFSGARFLRRGWGRDGRGGEGTTRTKRRVRSEREVWHRLTHGERGKGSGGRAAFCAWDGARRRTLMPSVAVVSLSLHSGAPSAAPALCTLHTCLFLGPQAPARASGASSSRALPSLLPPAASPPQLMIARPLASHPL